MKKVAVWLLAALLLFSLCACGQSGLRKVNVNEVTHSVFYAPQYAAMALGFFEEEGLEIDLVNGGGSDKSMTALLSGDADIGLMGPETAVYVYNQGKEDHPMIVGQLTKRDGSLLVGREKDDGFDWQSLKGKTIIGGRKGGMPQMTLEYVLKHNGLTPGTDVNVRTVYSLTSWRARLKAATLSSSRSLNLRPAYVNGRARVISWRRWARSAPICPIPAIWCVRRQLRRMRIWFRAI